MSATLFHHRVRVETRDAIAYVTMVRGDRHNALDLDMFRGLTAAARAVRKDRSLRAVILSGEGPSFCSGLDVPSFTKRPLDGLRIVIKYPLRATNLAQDAAWVWRTLPIPVIAVLHGRCYGGGLQIALGCDFRFAAPDCELSIMEAKWGLVPDMSGIVTLRELLPMDVAKELAMTARVLSAAQAQALGLVTQVTDTPLAAAEHLIAEIKTRSPDAVAGVKTLFHRAWNASTRHAFAAETRIQLRMFLTRNQREAVRANLEKRAPEYSERSYGG